MGVIMRTYFRSHEPDIIDVIINSIKKKINDLEYHNPLFVFNREWKLKSKTEKWYGIEIVYLYQSNKLKDNQQIKIDLESGIITNIGYREISLNDIKDIIKDLTI